MVDVSVIVPVYNSAQYISKCINSLLEQDGAIEIIIINDASTDESFEIIEEYKERDSRITIINNDINRGAAYSRNIGLDKARGRYIMFVDSDDLLAPDAVKKITHKMDETNSDMAYLGMHMFPEMASTQKSIQGEYRGLFSGEKLLQRFITNSEFFLYLCSVCYKRSFVENNKLRFQNIKIGEGGDFILRALLEADRVIVDSDVLYYYRIHNESITHSKDFKKEILLGQAKQYFSVLQIYYKNQQSVGCGIALNYVYKKMLGGIQNNTELENEYILQNLENELQRSLFKQIAGICDVYKINIKRYLTEIENAKCIILYGAGHATEAVLKELSLYRFEILGIAVSKKKDESMALFGHHVYEIQELCEYREKALVLITANRKYNDEIVNTLKENGFNNYIMLDIEI